MKARSYYHRKKKVKYIFDLQKFHRIWFIFKLFFFIDIGPQTFENRWKVPHLNSVNIFANVTNNYYVNATCDVCVT